MTDNEILPTKMASETYQSNKFDDWETRRSVELQRKIERYMPLFFAFIIFIQVIQQAKSSDLPLVFILIISVALGLFYNWLLSKIARAVIIKPMRAWRYGGCTKRMQQIAEKQIDYSKWSSWKAPAMPRVLAINARTSTVFIEGPDTDYYGLTLSSLQILDVKVEREQSVYTTTEHSSRSIYTFGESNFGILGGGSSWSSSTVVESAFLEIAYILDPGGTPRRAVFPFSGQRREADDWVLAINQLRTRT